LKSLNNYYKVKSERTEMSEERKAIFMELYDPNHSRFERFCKARVYGEMDFKDLMHDTVVIAFQKFDPSFEKASFLSFLFGIAIRVLANNKRRKEKDVIHKNTIRRDDVFYDHTVKKEAIEQLYAALSELPDIQKESIILFEIVGYAIKEIAELHKVSENVVKQRLFRGRNQLRLILTRQNEINKTIGL
jgi:RNA polymerase sigma-70 factor (ECF subfamily)